MTKKQKERAIKKIVKELLKEAHKDAILKIGKALKSGSVEVSGWSKDTKPYYLPKVITTAILQDVATTYDGEGTGFEKKIKKEVKNIRHFI